MNTNNDGFGNLDRVDMTEIEREDAARFRRQAESKLMANRRRGHKGSRVWGYSTGGGKRGSKR